MLLVLFVTTVVCGAASEVVWDTIRVRLPPPAAVAPANKQQQQITTQMMMGRTINMTKPATVRPTIKPTFTVDERKGRREGGEKG